jgi:hypothetical protein
MWWMHVERFIVIEEEWLYETVQGSNIFIIVLCSVYGIGYVVYIPTDIYCLLFWYVHWKY